MIAYNVIFGGTLTIRPLKFFRFNDFTASRFCDTLRFGPRGELKAFKNHRVTSS